MHVAVTAEHIHRGEASNPTGCPVFLALADVVGEDNVISVEDEGAWLSDCGTSRYLAFPSKAFAFIRLFDKGEYVAPFTFEFAA